VLPLSSLPETAGTMTNLERRVQRVRQAVPPRNGIETWRLICRLAARMGYQFKMKYGTIDEVTEEIRRVVPIYRDVRIDDVGADGVWDLSRFPLVKGAAPPLTPKPTTPTVTLGLDCLEERFATRMAKLFEEARKRLEAAG
jgi:anaerobic selenocysteine-containing dehydrogenase